MDHILEGVLASNHPEAMKRQLIEKICEKGQDQHHPPNDVRAVLQLTINWVLQGTSELQVSSGFKLFKTWAQHHLPVLENLLTRDLLVSLISKPSRNHANLPLLLTEALTLLRDQESTKVFLQHLKILSAKAAVFLQESPDVSAIKNYLQMLLHFKDSLPKGDLAERLAIPLMRMLAAHHIPADERQVYRFIVDVTALTDVLQQVWKESSLNLLLSCLQELFNIISAVEGPEPSVALGALVRLIPTEVVKSAVSAVVLNARISDGAVNAALRRMLDWLVWPTCKKLDEWIICFLNELAAAKKFSILIDITESKVDQVLDKLQYAPVREASFNILSHMLLSFQHSPQPFHKVLQTIPDILAMLEGEGTEESLQWRLKLAELLHCLMFLHTGFPDLYDTVLDLIKDVPCPSAEEISSRLSERRWSTQQCRTSQAPMFSAQLLKSETGKTGLFNLGNTCYMNSVLQSLFMCDDFRRQTLRQCPRPDEGLLDKLQHVFASLLLSQRPAIAPMKFLSASRPPWFTPGQQQDCSEFLKFLLDQMHEQELHANKKRPKLATATASTESKPASLKGKELQTESESGAESVKGAAAAEGWESSSVDSERDCTLVRHWFGGKMRLTSRCLSCQHESHRVEDFIDISLAFPQVGADSVTLASPPSLKALIGGGSHLPNSQLTRPQDSAASLLKSPATSSLPSGETAPSRLTHLTELLSHFLSPERMEGDNQYQCEQCGRLQDGERTISIVDSPRYLILTLLRFNYDAQTQTRSKIFREVSCPRTLALPVQGCSSDVATSSSTATKRRKKLLHHLQPRLPSSVSSSPENCELYGLCSVVIHSGASSECGHYYCFSRHSQVGDADAVISSLDKVAASNSCSVNAGASDSVIVDMPAEEETDIDFLQDKWCLFNDARVSSVTFSSFRNLGKRFPKDTPYVLVYKKLSLDCQDDEPWQEPPLRQGLRDAVNKDNSQYLKEQEVAAKAKASRQRSSSSTSTTFSHWRDFDSDQGPPGSCGGGGGLDTSGARFVF